MPIDKYINWLYKDGKAELFKGDEIQKKVKEGWTDHPDKKADSKDDEADKKGAAGSGAVTTESATSGAVTKETKSP